MGRSKVLAARVKNSEEDNVLYILIINCLVVTISVVLHYQFLYWLTQYFRAMGRGRHRFRVALGVLGALLAHTAEIWLFAFAYYFIGLYGQLGHLEGYFDGSLMDCVYFSFSVFSTLGFGDIQPVGAIRYLAGIESLTGLLLIAWSASFLYFEMQRYWGIDSDSHGHRER